MKTDADADDAKCAAFAHEIWAAAQLAPGEGIEDGVCRIERLLRRFSEPNASTHED